VSHAEKLALVSKYKRVSDPTNKRSVAKQYRTLKAFPARLTETREQSSEKGIAQARVFTTDKGVVVDGPGIHDADQ